MTTRFDRSTLLATAACIGFFTDFLFTGADDPGLAASLFFGAVAVGVLVTAGAAGRRPGRESLGWLAAGVAFASVFALRGSHALVFIAFATAVACFGFAAYRGGAAWVGRASVADFVEAVPAGALHCLFGPLRLVFGRSAPAESPRPMSFGAVARGLLIALPLVLVFGLLFAAGDRLFADTVSALLGRVVEAWGPHLAVALIFGWLATGFLLGFLDGTRLRDRLPRTLPRPALGAVEVGIALGAVNLLFAAFVAVQFRYLFGGAALIEATPGLTYAEHAREGFGQLAVAAALVLPLLLAADFLFRPDGRGRRLVPTLGWTLLALLGVVIVSAVRRVQLYQATYGLTESRFYALAVLGWVAFAALWLGLTVLRHRRERFAPIAVVSLVALAGGLQLANPARHIARHNLAQSGIEVDGAYLAELGADAVPTLVGALDSAPPEARCALASGLIERWRDRPAREWRDWNLSASRAREAVARSQTRLVAAAAACLE